MHIAFTQCAVKLVISEAVPLSFSATAPLADIKFAIGGTMWLRARSHSPTSSPSPRRSSAGILPVAWTRVVQEGLVRRVHPPWKWGAIPTTEPCKGCSFGAEGTQWKFSPEMGTSGKTGRGVWLHQPKPQKKNPRPRSLMVKIISSCSYLYILRGYFAIFCEFVTNWFFLVFPTRLSCLFIIYDTFEKCHFRAFLRKKIVKKTIINKGFMEGKCGREFGNFQICVCLFIKVFGIACKFNSSRIIFPR